jgi:hypothetical protein
LCENTLLVATEYFTQPLWPETLFNTVVALHNGDWSNVGQALLTIDYTSGQVQEKYYYPADRYIHLQIERHCTRGTCVTF